MRFDFTGLGGSEGDFSDTAFSTNVDDLVDAGYVSTDTAEVFTGLAYQREHDSYTIQRDDQPDDPPDAGVR